MSKTYLTCLKERLLDIGTSSKIFNNLPKEELNAQYNLRDNQTIIIKGAGKVSAVVIWEREAYIKEASKQIEDKHVFAEGQNDPSILINTITHSLEKVKIRGDLANGTHNYFLVKDPKFDRFHPLCKIHKSLHDIRGMSYFQTLGSTQKISPHCYTIIYNL